MPFPEPVPLTTAPATDGEVAGFAVVMADGSLVLWTGDSPMFHRSREALENMAKGYFSRRAGENYRIVPAKIVVTPD